jgi:prolyl 4-hydroxylase
VYFECTNRLGQVDESSLHAGGRVLRGEKWVVTKWMRERRFAPAAAKLPV